MQTTEKRDMIPTVREGFLICPYDGARIMRVLPKTTATNLVVWCRKCKREYVVNIDRGERL